MGAYKEYLVSAWESRLKQLGHVSPLEERELRLARVGMIIATTFLVLMGISEVLFFGMIFWYMIR
jgi:hypothetical protein